MQEFVPFCCKICVGREQGEGDGIAQNINKFAFYC